MFTIALLYPLLLQAAHNFDYHEHSACSDVDTHFHEKQMECELHDLFLASCDFEPNNFEQLTTRVIVANTTISTKTSFYYSEVISLFFLRGPPSYS